MFEQCKYSIIFTQHEAEKSNYEQKYATHFCGCIATMLGLYNNRDPTDHGFWTQKHSAVESFNR